MIVNSKKSKLNRSFIIRQSVIINRNIRRYLHIFVIVILSHITLYPQTNHNYIRLKTGIHFDSRVSGGQYSLSELAAYISRIGLDVAIITDHDNMKVSYGVAPFQNFLRYSIEENSINSYGVEKYIDEIDQLDKFYPNIIIIPGVEAVPFYFWEGSPLSKNLSLRNWHTHLLVFGFNDVKAYKNLPSIPNGIRYKKPSGNIPKYIGENFMHFAFIIIIFLLFLISFFLIIRRRPPPRDIAHIRRKRGKHRFSWKSFIFAIIFGFILKLEYPYLPPLYDQYHGDPGVGPFQELIDYVNKNDGMIYWAHPEVNNSELRPVNIPLLSQTISISTEAYPHLIAEASNYTGFAIFWEGMKVIGKPRGLWDLVLMEYCQGIRQKPVWSIGELDFEESNNLNLISETNTFIFVKEKSRAGVYEALKAGRSYSTRSFLGDKLVLEDFSIYDMYTKNSAFIGETLNLVSPPPVIHIRIKWIKPGNHQETVLLYRNTELIKKFVVSDLLDKWYVDKEPISDKMYYYRILVGEKWCTLATNPIFIRKQE
ncbi:MAG: hypothetical protein ISS81_08435 [Candidatus Marinimicrobia bacterium]|nr:hypothetical protein [Candidatus Neomarinimicrobiota bacterium]